MSLLVTYVLTAGCVLVVVVTRRVLGGLVPRLLLGLHTGLGAVGAALWLLFLVLPGEHALVGVLGLGCWWVVSIVGLLLLSRWMPSRGTRGKRAAPQARVGAPWLSILGHVGVFVAAMWFTYAYVTSRV